jgi:transcriptional regulator with XRE-family HTH domain
VAAQEQEHRRGATAGPQPTSFGRLLRDYRTERHLSQATLARLAGVSAGYVGLIETGDRGERPSLDIVKRFAQGLSLDVSETECLMRASGHLGPHETLIQDGRASFATTVANNRRLTSRQKELLISLYDSWLGEGASVEPG